jgi:hypothetical protein
VGQARDGGPTPSYGWRANEITRVHEGRSGRVSRGAAASSSSARYRAPPIGTAEIDERVDILDNLSDDPLAPHSLSARELTQLLSAERAGEPFLAFRDQQGLLCLFVPDRERQTVTVGRRDELDLSIQWDPEVSGLHAELQYLAGEWAIVDDGLSRNGTYVEDRRVVGRRRLRDGDRIRLGGTVLTFKAPRAARVQETVAAADRPALPSLTDTQRRVLVALCRPYRDGGGFATPATNQQIAAEVFLSVDAVKTHLRTLFGKFELGSLPQNRKRARLAECALQFGVISPHELG